MMKERCVKQRFDNIPIAYKRKRLATRKELPRGDLIIDDVPSPNT
jgi:hypothetical protein